MTTPAALLTAPIDRVAAPSSLWGFGGLHGGLGVAALTSAMQVEAGPVPLRSVTAQLHQPIRDDAAIDAWRVRAGRTTVACAASARSGDRVHISASAVFASAGPRSSLHIAPCPPDARSPWAYEVYTIPTELVPFAAHTEIRPVGAARPFAAGATPELVAWVRLVEDDLPPDALRLIVLLDALAPSYAAVMSTVAAVPTVELTVRPSDALADAASPWVLLRARTRSASGDGWIDEVIDAWGTDGRHLGSATQLRVIRPA